MDVLSDMVVRAKRSAGIDPNTPLESLVYINLHTFSGARIGSVTPPPPTQGMSLSGGELEEGQERIRAGLADRFPHTSRHYQVCTDTFGSIATAFPNGTYALSTSLAYACTCLSHRLIRTRL